MDTIIENSCGENLDYTYSPGEPALLCRGWIVILGHGVTGDKDRPLITDTAQALNEAGFDTLRFSFAGNGKSSGDFRDASITKEVADLDSVITAVCSSYPNICYIGHSMGAAVGVIQAAQDKRIDALVSLAGMVNTKAFAETEFGEETPESGCMWEDTDCPLSAVYMEDLCETIQSVAPQAKQINIPWLLLHGSADDVVLPKDTEQVTQIKANAVNAIYIEGADHSFNDPEHKAQLTAAVTSWLSEHSSSRSL
jgi:alpha/beta superfamily hydrolase